MKQNAVYCYHILVPICSELSQSVFVSLCNVMKHEGHEFMNNLVRYNMYNAMNRLITSLAYFWGGGGQEVKSLL